MASPVWLPVVTTWPVRSGRPRLAAWLASQARSRRGCPDGLPPTAVFTFLPLTRRVALGACQSIERQDAMAGPKVKPPFDRLSARRAGGDIRTRSTKRLSSSSIATWTAATASQASSRRKACRSAPAGRAPGERQLGLDRAKALGRGGERRRARRDEIGQERRRAGSRGRVWGTDLPTGDGGAQERHHLGLHGVRLGIVARHDIVGERRQAPSAAARVNQKRRGAHRVAACAGWAAERLPPR